jgi:hypothetical protein
MGLLRLAEDRLAENLNWPTSQLAENTIARKLKLAENEQVVHLLVFGQFQLFLQYSLFTFCIFWCILYSTTVLFNLELWKNGWRTTKITAYHKKHAASSQ